MKFKDIERIILNDGWKHKNTVGSHYQYKHTLKKGKVTIPFHSGDIDPRTVKSIMKQAGL